MFCVGFVVIIEEVFHELTHTGDNQFDLVVSDVVCGCYDEMVTVVAIGAARTRVDPNTMKLGEACRRVSPKVH
jgi:hypothetical protein